MKVKCLANTGYGLNQYTIDNSGDTVYAKYPLKVGEVYNVYGQCIIDRMLNYLILGTYQNLPWWYPAELFEVTESLLPLEWYYRYNNDCVISAMWGYKEMVLDEAHYEELMERESPAIEIFLKRKKEIDEF